MKPPIRYAQSGDVSIAYQVVGDGAIDFIHVPGWVSHLDHAWENPRIAAFYRHLASFTRLILFDKRGTGLSDRGGPPPTLEQRMDDVRAVMDAAGSTKAVIWGVSEGAAMSILFAATYPERTTALVIYAGFARAAWAPDYAFGRTAEEFETRLTGLRTTWGTGAGVIRVNPSLARDDAFREWAAQNERTAASPGSVRDLARVNYAIDTRHVLAAVRVPTLVLHRRDDAGVNVEHGRHVARHIPNAKYVELDGADHAWGVNPEQIIGEIEEFLTGARQPAEIDRVLVTVLFTDIVGSTTQAVQLGDRQWRKTLEAHHAVVREELRRFRGREIDTAGDGFLAAFDGPARAIRAATSISGRVKNLGLSVRAGLHTGECEVIGDKLTGIAVHIGARIAGLAGPDEVLVSSTVKDLVAGSGLRFRERGAHQLKGVPGAWDLFSVERD